MFFFLSQPIEYSEDSGSSYVPETESETDSEDSSFSQAKGKNLFKTSNLRTKSINLSRCTCFSKTKIAVKEEDVSVFLKHIS